MIFFFFKPNKLGKKPKYGRELKSISLETQYVVICFDRGPPLNIAAGANVGQQSE